MNRQEAETLANKFIAFIQSGNRQTGLFTPDVALDFTSPGIRIQTRCEADAYRVRFEGHPWPSTVPAWRFDPTPSGFVIEWEEIWEHAGQRWFCREIARCVADDAGVRDIAVYCTGDNELDMAVTESWAELHP